VACLAPAAEGESALDELAELVELLPASTALAVLPELFCYDHTPGGDLAADAGLAERAIAAMQAACSGRVELVLCASLVLPVEDHYSLIAVLVNSGGVVAMQRQLHYCKRHDWSACGDELDLVDLPWGRVALFAGDDAVHPELVKVAALDGAHVIAVPFAMQESWEEAYGLRSRAAENRMCVVASSRPLAGRAGLIASLEREFTLMTPWQDRTFDGFINAPLVTEQKPDAPITAAQIHPNAACNKLMSERTDLLLDRPWQLSHDLLLHWQDSSGNTNA
jgi:predicted amidohydrolase